MRKKNSKKRKIHFAPRLNVTHKKNKFIICTSDIYSRDLLLATRWDCFFCCVYEASARVDINRKKKKEKSNVDCVALRLALSHSLPHFEGTTLNCLINNLFMWLLLFCRRIFSLIMTDGARWGERRGWHNIDQSADDVHTTRWFSAESQQLFAREAIKLQSDLICSHLSLQKFAFRTQERHSKKI